MFNILRRVFGKSEADSFAYNMQKAGDGIESRKSYSGDHGSSLLVNLIAIGLLNNIGKQRPFSIAKRPFEFGGD